MEVVSGTEEYARLDDPVFIEARARARELTGQELVVLRLSVEVILAHPDAVPPGLYAICDDWADVLAVVSEARTSNGSREPMSAEANT